MCTYTRAWRVRSLFLGAAALLACLLGPSVLHAAEQQQFATPKEALHALVEAAKTHNKERLLALFGSENSDLVISGDDVADREALENFVEAVTEKTLYHEDGDKTVRIFIGDDELLFPIPLIRDDDRGWRFDTAAGKEELLNRRIGRNELTAIDVCHAYVDAQREYATMDRDGDNAREYASKVHSSAGKRDGLYWEVSANEEPSPMGPLFATAAAEGYDPGKSETPQPYHGYLFRVLTTERDKDGTRSYVVDSRLTGGFALLAYPAHYRSSGVMTFMVNHLGIVFQKDLGEKTEELAAAITAYEVDDSWSPARESDEDD